MQLWEIIRFKNEVYFYNIIGRYFTEKISPYCYVATTNLKDFKQPIIVMEDVSDYNEMLGNLNEDVRKEHMRLVAFFHANSMRLMNENNDASKKMLSYLHITSVRQTQKERMVAR